MNEHAEFSLLDEFVLGTLAPADAERVASHLAACADCRSEFAELRSVIDVLPHGLSVAEAPAELRDRIFAAIDAPVSSAVAVLPAARPSSAGSVRRSPSFGLVAGLAAALVLALAGDAYFALRAPRGTEVAVVAPSSAPVAVPTAHPLPSTTPAVPPTVAPPTVAPPTAAPATASPVTPPPTPDARGSAELARLERELHAARTATVAEDARVRALERALATARTVPPRVVTVLITPSPTASSTGTPPTATPTDAPELVAALRTGKVYTLDGAVDHEAWHLTIVQPRDGAHALLYSGTPDAPSGETYRSWVVRGAQTVSIGELPPGKPATIEMPMALQTGDVIAFSREPVGSGDLPTTKFLMELKITP